MEIDMIFAVVFLITSFVVMLFVIYLMAL